MRPLRFKWLFVSGGFFFAAYRCRIQQPSEQTPTIFASPFCRDKTDLNYLFCWCQGGEPIWANPHDRKGRRILSPW